MFGSKMVLSLKVITNIDTDLLKCYFCKDLFHGTCSEDKNEQVAVKSKIRNFNLATTKNNIILTTKKDYYKLSQFKIDNLLYMDIKVEFLDGKQEFLSTIKEVLI